MTGSPGEGICVCDNTYRWMLLMFRMILMYYEVLREMSFSVECRSQEYMILSVGNSQALNPVSRHILCGIKGYEVGGFSFN